MPNFQSFNGQGIGLPLEEAIRFWRAEMAATAPADKFDKEFLYNVRHNYGKEGNRRDYTPYTCARIISTMPGTVRYCRWYRSLCLFLVSGTLAELELSHNHLRFIFSGSSAWVSLPDIYDRIASECAEPTTGTSHEGAV